MTVSLFPFRYLDPLTGRWVKARYKAAPEEIAARHAQWEICGPAEIRAAMQRAFNPYRVIANAEIKRLEEIPPQLHPQRARPPGLDANECALVTLFLRRYVTYCARRRRLARTEAAVRLYREVAAARERARDNA